MVRNAVHNAFLNALTMETKWTLLRTQRNSYETRCWTVCSNLDRNCRTAQGGGVDWGAEEVIVDGGGKMSAASAADRWLVIQLGRLTLTEWLTTCLDQHAESSMQFMYRRALQSACVLMSRFFTEQLARMCRSDNAIQPTALLKFNCCYYLVFLLMVTGK